MSPKEPQGAQEDPKRAPGGTQEEPRRSKQAQEIEQESGTQMVEVEVEVSLRYSSFHILRLSSIGGRLHLISLYTIASV